MKLNNGITIPEIGYGVFRMKNLEECEEAVVQAIQAGYRWIDTAAAYKNEEAVGRAIHRCGIPREELFISTKLWVTDASYDKAREAFDESMKKLGLDYVDLYIVHMPYGDYHGAWRALEELYSEGKVRAIGVDNFVQERLADFMFWHNVKPAINFLEVNPFFQRPEELEYLESKDIQLLAWSPLSAGNNNIFNNEVLLKIGKEHNKTVAQIVLRWLVQRNIIPVVKSSNPQRMKENLEIFDFKLTDQEMETIKTLDTGHTCFPPRNTGEAVEAFLTQAVTGAAPTSRK